ncbi:MAG: PKD domain-containing protein [Bacteroidota bacterium]
MKNKYKFLSRTTKMFLCLSIAVFFTSCQDLYEFELPESNSIEDTLFPLANFSYASTLEDFRTIKFTNLSAESTNFVWDFGGGNTTTETDPIFTFEQGEGTYPVSLTASDANGMTNTITVDVEVVEGPFQPIILEAGFEDNSLPDGSGDGRDSWRNSTLGGVIQITGSPVQFGSQGAKLPNDESRIGYQEIAVEANTNYDLRFWYTMLDNSADPFVTVSVLGVTEFGPFESREATADGTLASVTVNDVSDPSAYVEQKLSFNSGENSVVAIYFFNGPVEARLDNFSIDIGAEGSVPPSASFNTEQSEVNFLEYAFSNTSTNATTYEWDFGDGNTSTEENPTHVYSSAAEYTITLTAKNDVGLSGTFSKSINILAPVTADFTYQVDPDDYRTYTFMDASEGAVMQLWEFGDGFQFTGMNPSHTYKEDGEYTVTMTAYSETGNTDVATAKLVISQGFIVQVLNGTFQEFTNNTSDNADAWDMTPNSTVVDNDGNEIPSPYRELWYNSELNNYIDATYCTNEQPNSTSDGAFENGSNTRGGKFSASCRRLYQVVQVQQGVEYTFSIDTRSEVEGINTEVFILNTEITTEAGIDASKSDPAIDGYYDITNDFNEDKSMFTTSTFTFTASTNQVVIYVRALNAIDSSNEVFLDNVKIVETE